ncbi:hypothetical protein PF005_g24221 [Phytophthora fragariae]|uniref:Uncharacterized protein n=1 Tax=Phytophthora fragariae TaxID=53985 RepID=A0A6A3HCM5_9STRA|nr:hypothetical protein PF003_g17004 [Phytophthora fragariae]KAE8927123.1 hypothetical protein PF009_g22704 [Phytophthora fragariae]KAE8967251.1 hypothetical protein PF011_g27622 [Phytophthora fragariae]KAE9077172.1 hypothetical protein PF010_g23611 [Phytophthora fragariae]KAE9077470.1 hypothetical protein PF007_g24235 [Phytophthora fragariae]
MLFTGFNALPSSAAAEMNTAAVEPAANATLHNNGGRTMRSETDDPSDATGLAFTDEDADDELPPSTKGAEDEERAFSKPSASTEPLWVKVFYKIFPHVKRPAADIQHKPLRPPRFIDAGNGMVKLSTKH